MIHSVVGPVSSFAASVARAIEAAVPARAAINEAGLFFQAEIAAPAALERGGMPLAEALAIGGDAAMLAGRDPELGEFDAGSAVFLDTETTGLAGGTGTYAFLVGLGFFDNRQFVVRQFFMRDLAEERAMMAAVGAELRRFQSSVTFNGKAFDLPLLRTRFIMSRTAPQADHMVHFDLLHACRRLWRSAPFAERDGMKLGALEKGLLGHERPVDVQSWEIPEIYLNYLRGGSADRLAAVFAHNLEDIVAMAGLLARIGAAMRSWRSPGAVEPHALLGIGRVLELAGRPEEALDAYGLAVAGGLEAHLAERAWLAAALINKRAGRWQEALSIWQRIGGGQTRGAEAACVEAAKYCEHLAGDFRQAYEWCRRASEIAQGMPEPAAGQLSPGELDRRATRLRAKLAAPRRDRPPLWLHPGKNLVPGPLRS